jgi:hypothetical protein
MKKIISVSRRSDVPAFQADWFFEGLKKGEISYKVSPKHLPSKVSLKKEHVECFVFWSKGYNQFMDRLDELDSYGIPFYFHFTINNYPKVYEPKVPPVKRTIQNFITLSKRYGQHRVIWRYDPIFFTKEIGIQQHNDNFEELLNELGPYTDSCYVSVIDLYGKLKSRPLIVEKFDMELLDKGGAIRNMLAYWQNALGLSKGVQIYTCAEKNYEQVPGVKKGTCINAELIQALTGTSRTFREGPTREACGCAMSTDIGTYNTCKHGCVYCYANS